MGNHCLKRIFSLFALFLSFSTLSAQTSFRRAYTQENPLVYVDSWDLWPYSYLNDQGEPEGFNIDLIRLMMKEMGIPYVIKLKPQQDAFRDLKTGKSDLTLGLAVGFHDEYGLYSKNAITLFTQSVVAPKDAKVEIKNFRDLGKPGTKVIVSDSSLCHHLMLDYGWGKNAVPVEDMREAIRRMSVEAKGQIVWNTLSLKWLMNRYKTDNLELTAVNMPHGEYKFMSNDQALLDALDETYSRLYTAEQIFPIQTKWFYPERKDPPTPWWVWFLDTFAMFILLAAGAYALTYALQRRQIKGRSQRLNNRLALILQTSQVRIWTYDVEKKEFAWRNEKGQVAYHYTMEEFSQRYPEEDYNKLKGALEGLIASNQKYKGRDEEEEVRLELKARDEEDGGHEWHDFVVVLSVLIRDKQGKPTVIVGIKKDVTEQHKMQQRERERMMRFWSIFNTPIVGVLYYDKDGYLMNINKKACEIFQCDKNEIIAEHVHLNDCFDCELEDLREANGLFATQIVDLSSIPSSQRLVKSVRRKKKLYCEYRMMTVKGDGGQLLGVFVVCRDTKHAADIMEQLTADTKLVDDSRQLLEQYDMTIDRVVGHDDIRLVVYSPQSHLLTILRDRHKVEHTLTQTRCMTLIDNASKKLTMRALNDMDARVDKEISVLLGTTLRVKGGRQLVLRFAMQPTYNSEGAVENYQGVLGDISALREMEKSLKAETAKVMEVENTKNSFLQNMVQEIRTPLDTLVGYVDRLGEERMGADEEMLRKGIVDNSNTLLHLINNVLYLSRLEAGMVEINPEPQDIAELFGALCQKGWEPFRNDQTKYLVDNPYEQLEVVIDVPNLGNVIEQLTANAAQHTKSGIVRARCEYIGRRLVITIDDTGEGIPPQELERIMQSNAGSQKNTKGLGLAITRELIRQMEGKLEIISDIGIGTTVYVTLRCEAITVKRKKQLL